MQSRRHQRVRELLIRAIGEVLRRELPLSEAGLITVNDVSLSGDLHSAVAYISVLGNEEQRKKALALVQQHRKHIQGEVAHAVVLKYTPELRFAIDDSIERGNRVMQLIEELEKDQTAQ